MVRQQFKDNYNDVKIVKYPFVTPEIGFLKTETLKSISELSKLKSNNEWSIAILCPTKKLMLEASKVLTNPFGKVKHSITHEVMVDPTGPALSAVLISNLLGGLISDEKVIIKLLIDFIIGSNGGKTNQTDLKLCDGLKDYLENDKLRGSTRKSVVDKAKDIITERKNVKLRIPAILTPTIRFCLTP